MKNTHILLLDIILYKCYFSFMGTAAKAEWRGYEQDSVPSVFGSSNGFENTLSQCKPSNKHIFRKPKWDMTNVWLVSAL